MCLSKHPQKTSGTQQMCSRFTKLAAFSNDTQTMNGKSLNVRHWLRLSKHWDHSVGGQPLLQQQYYVKIPHFSVFCIARRSHSLTTACHPCPAITNANLAVGFGPWWQNTLNDLWGPSESDIWLPSHLCDLHLFWLMINLCQQLYSRSKSPASTFKPPAEHPPRS